MSELRPGWTRVKFGEIAECVNDRVDDPSASGVERYVGLDHLDSDSLTIRRWGTPGEVESTKLRFQPGDIIFGKRRAYQRKLAIADFEGICSAHAMVLRAKPTAIDPDFLPFFMQSDVFMDRAKEISVGSLSPTINWKTLALQEFALPPVEEQRQVSTILRSLDGTIEALAQAEVACKLTAAAMLPDMTKFTTTLEEVCEFVTDGDHNPPKRVDNGIPHLVVKNVVGGELTEVGATRISAEDYARVSRRYTPRGGDIVITCVGTIGEIGYVRDGQVFSADRSLAICRPDVSRVQPRYLSRALSMLGVQRQMSRVARGTAQQHLYLKELRDVSVQIPPINLQEEVVARLDVVDRSSSELARRRSQAGDLRSRLLNGDVS